MSHPGHQFGGEKASKGALIVASNEVCEPGRQSVSHKEMSGGCRVKKTEKLEGQVDWVSVCIEMRGICLIQGSRETLILRPEKWMGIHLDVGTPVV